MRRYKVIVLGRAVEQIEEIEEYIHHVIGNPFAARNVVDRIDASIASLHFAPHRNPIGHNRYKIHIKHFTITYKILNEKVFVDSVIYSRRNILF